MKVQLSKFYHKAALSTSISTLVKAINPEHFEIWPNGTANIIQNFSLKPQKQAKSTCIKFNRTTNQLITSNLLH